jgi:hypothetical protein
MPIPRTACRAFMKGPVGTEDPSCGAELWVTGRTCPTHSTKTGETAVDQRMESVPIFSSRTVKVKSSSAGLPGKFPETREVAT